MRTLLILISLILLGCQQDQTPKPLEDWTGRIPDAKVTPAPIPKVRHFIWCKVTGYDDCPSCCPGQSHRTSTGLWVPRHPVGIAADPRAVPYQTRLRVPGYGEALVDDTGGAMRQDWHRGIVHLDVRLPTHQLAREFGVRWCWVEIVD
jgi:3D (Asp-Asp-Asp) domain-containing protein